MNTQPFAKNIDEMLEARLRILLVRPVQMTVASSVTQLAMPLAPIHIANALWLIVKGFKEPHLPLPAERQRANV